jgi:hypothetical protein
MGDRIRMGNDEFILYVRKRGTTLRDNDQLGKAIWQWLRDHASGWKVDDGGNRLPDDDGRVKSPPLWTADRAGGLPIISTQFEFDRAQLPALFDRLDEL